MSSATPFGGAVPQHDAVRPAPAPGAHRPLVVLLTNFELDVRGGTQLYVRDVALKLLARGHTPVVYSPRLGEVAQELGAATVPVTDDLRTLTVTPDIVHAHHNHELFTALLRFPETPAVRVCHGWFDDCPQPFPRVLRYLAVSEAIRDRCVYEWGVPADRLDVLLNFTDLDRFKPRGPLAERPARALVFSHNAREHLWAVRTACEGMGIAVDAIGRSVGRSSASPERVLGDYDVVFARGRAALEAMACGTAVVVCDAEGVGPLVTAAELPKLRRQNFGIRMLTRPISPDAIRQELARYDAADAAEVSRQVRLTASVDAVVDALVACYQEVIEEFRQSLRYLDEEYGAAAAYLRSLSPRVYWTETPASTRQLLLKSVYASTSSLPGVRALLRTRWARRAVLGARDWRRRLTMG
jgi:glycosyltransferase involved in cell wall biosynthesis